VGDTDAIVKSIPLTTTFISAPSSTFSMNFTNANKVRLVNFNNADVVTYVPVGSGKAVYIGFDNFNTNPETQHIIADAVKSAGQLARPSWAVPDITSGTIAAGDSTIVTIVFHANGIPAGIYNGVIGVSTNDPLNPVIPVFCSMTVIGDPIISLSDTCLDFGTIIENTSAVDTLQITNIGCDSLVVSSIFPNNPAYTVSPLNAILIPGQSINVVVTFSPTAVGNFNTTVDVLNNAINTSFCLTGDAGPAPVYSSVSSVNHSVAACGATSSTTFDISNIGVAGAADLTYSISTPPSWLTITNGSGAIPVGTSATVTCTFNSGTFAGGPQVANLTISTNDPLNTTVPIAITMDVEFNPCFSWTATLSTCTGIGTFTTGNLINAAGASWSWDFGDGGTSTDQNPLHQYALPGTYTVTAIATNASGADTVINSVTLTVITGPTPAACLPITSAYCCGVGLTHVGFVNINKSSSIHGYQNFTCTDTTTVLECQGYPFSATTGITYEENLKAYIDFDNDGIFNNTNELVFVDTMIFTNHSGTISIPCVPPNINIPLRFRIGSDYSGNPPLNGCTDLLYGSYWDFVVFIQMGVGKSELEQEVGFNVSPNPYKNETKIEYTLHSSDNVTVEVFNLVGAKVAAFANDEMQSIGKHSYNFGGAEAGIYFVKLTVGDRSITQKIVSMQ
jgi:hypothetical protein